MYSELPLVTFEYPDSETDYLRTRYVRVVSMDRTHVKGYEFTTGTPSDTDEGKFKSYLLAKIVENGVALVEFGID
jgi:hypothetical protein